MAVVVLGLARLGVLLVCLFVLVGGAVGFLVRLFWFGGFALGVCLRSVFFCWGVFFAFVVFVFFVAFGLFAGRRSLFCFLVCVSRESVCLFWLGVFSLVLCWGVCLLATVCFCGVCLCVIVVGQFVSSETHFAVYAYHGELGGC